MPCEKPVVPGAVHDFGLGQFPDEPVKQTGEEGPDCRLSLACHPSGGHAVIPLVADAPHHLGQQGGRILQICVHDRHIIPRGVAKARIHGGFFPKIAGKGEVFDPAVGLGHLLDPGQGGILGTVVDKHVFKHIFRHQIGDPADFPVEQRDGLHLVVTGHDD